MDKESHRSFCYVDATVPLGGLTPVWETDPPVSVERIASFDAGDSCNITRIALSVHTGTHLDAPCHFLPAGSAVEQLPLEVLCGPAYVLNLETVTGPVEPPNLEEVPDNCERLVLRTANTTRNLMHRRQFTRDYAHLSPDAAQWIASREIRLVGIDYLSVERFRPPEPVVHRTLLRAGVIPVEGLDLTDVEPGWWELICLPLRITGSDGSPVRAVFRRPVG
ncbi:MAG: cyclase [Armatimonadota bacterium]|nr:MAG: cyclase [Armatimonadota bacterium]